MTNKLLRGAEVIFLLVVGYGLVDVIFSIANIGLVALQVTNPGGIRESAFDRINAVMVAKFAGTNLVNN